MADKQMGKLFGDRRYVLNTNKARADGYRIFRAWHCCGCCYVDMAFRTVYNARIQFDMPKFSDSIMDDMGVVHGCVNSLRGFAEVKLRNNPVKTTTTASPDSISDASSVVGSAERAEPDVQPAFQPHSNGIPTSSPPTATPPSFSRPHSAEAESLRPEAA